MARSGMNNIIRDFIPECGDNLLMEGEIRRANINLNEGKEGRVGKIYL